MFFIVNLKSSSNFVNQLQKELPYDQIICHLSSASIFLKDVFLHEEKYPYLLKQFDSKNHGFIHEIKIFRINYEIFDPNP